jgi:DNA-directed RNA polymerase beta subunit
MIKDGDILPEGVNLRDPMDQDTLRTAIFDGVANEFKNSFPAEYGNVRLELKDIKYLDKDTYTFNDQKDALLKNKFLGRRLQGTFRLVDKNTDEVLDEQTKTLMKVPYLTERGTFIHNGNDYATNKQPRLIPGPYTRRKANGELETHFNVKRGSGSAFRVRLEPRTGVYKLDIGQSSLNLYTLLHHMGVSDEDLERRWGTKVLEANKKGYDFKVIDKAYERMVPRSLRGDADNDIHSKVSRIREAFDNMKVHQRVTRKNLPNLFDPQASVGWQKQGSTVLTDAQDDMDNTSAVYTDSKPTEPDADLSEAERTRTRVTALIHKLKGMIGGTKEASDLGTLDNKSVRTMAFLLNTDFGASLNPAKGAEDLLDDVVSFLRIRQDITPEELTRQL